MVNKVILIGNLGKDPEVRTIDNGSKVANFSLAVTESYKDKTSGERIDKTEWFNLVIWRGVADIAERYLKKGSKIYVEGKLQTRTYDDKEGNTRLVTEIIVNQLQMLDSKSSSSSNSDDTQDMPF